MPRRWADAVSGWLAAAKHRTALEEVREAAERELAVERERDGVREASHELRTLIAVARGYAELIRRTHADEQAAADAGVIMAELDRMHTISERLLILAAADHPAFLRRGPVELERLIVDGVRRWSARAPRAWAVDAAVDGTVDADEERLDACLDALIENALKFTHEEDRIGVVARVKGGTAVIEVSDTGSGIARERLPRVFDRFSAPGAEAGGGTGLGLAIVKAIAEAHGGTVSVDSVAGGGATFRIHLPGFRQTPVPRSDTRVSTAAPATPAVRETV